MNVPTSRRDGMLAWASEIPPTWDLVQARRVFQERKSTGFSGEPLLSVTQEAGVVTREASDLRVWNPGDDVSGYKLVKAGDFVISLRSFQGGLERSEIRGLVSPAYTPFYSDRLEPAQLRFLAHYFKSQPFISSLQPLTTGIRQGKNISFTDFGESSLPVPEPDQARAVASFLDHEAEKIDTLIEMKRRLLDLLKEKRTALITRAVSKGLDPEVPMKDSGVEWIGEIPEGWDVALLDKLVQRTRPITYGIVQPGGTDPEGRFMVRGQDYSKEWAKPETIFRVSMEIEEPYRRARLAPGDLVVTIVGAGTGNVAKVPDWLEGANITQTTARVAPDVSQVNRDFLLLQLESDVGTVNVDLAVKGAAQPGLNLGHLAKFKVVLPPLREQKQIVDTLKPRLRRMAQVSDHITHAISLLQEYRTALISAAVTGKIHVRDKVPA